MADYYPLISRAVAGLERNNGESRRTLYERARAALLAQLRGVTPALNESDITRERLALEEAIRKVEAESARQFVDPSRSPPPKPRASEPPQWEEPARLPRDDAFRAAPPPPAPAPEVDRHEPQFDRTEQRMFEQREVHERPPHEDFPEPMLEPSFTVDETRPAPPKARRAPPAQVEDEEELEREEARPPR